MKDPPTKIGDEKLVEIARELRPLITFDSDTRFHPQDETTPQQMARVSEHLKRLTDVRAEVLVLVSSGQKQGAVRIVGRPRFSQAEMLRLPSRNAKPSIKRS